MTTDSTFVPDPQQPTGLEQVRHDRSALGRVEAGEIRAEDAQPDPRDDVVEPA
ncbi:MAG TPA: hypothetical protein VFF79_05895 [Conexibacter sp.]|nr:hypothetical protein [Conexibacter sp.]